MTRILLLSDSHGGKYHLSLIPEFCRERGIDRVFHLGDIVEDARWLQQQLDIPLSFVAGNCDWSSHCDRELRETIEGKRLLFVHGDRYGVKYGYDRLSYYAEENMMDAVFFGHTHRPFAAYVGRVLLVNPGALKDGSLCVLEISKKDIVPRILDIDKEGDKEK